MMTPLLVGVRSTELSPEEIETFTKIQPCGFVLFSRNIETADQTRRLTDSLRKTCSHEPLLCIDQEGGRVSRIQSLGINSPSAKALRLAKNQKKIATHAKLTAQILLQLGFNVDLAPVLDIAYNEGVTNSLTDRCFGSDSQETTSNAGVFNRTLIRHGLATCAKHFPTVGRAKSDPHHDLPIVEATRHDLLNTDLIPYNALMPELQCIMTAHVHFPDFDSNSSPAGLPASLSKEIITKFLRNQLGFKGIIMTDDLDMGAIIAKFSLPEAACLAIEAGNDLPMVCHSFDQLSTVAQAIQKLKASLLSDIQRRMEKFSKKSLHKPMPLNLSTWENLVAQANEFASEFSPEQPTPGTTSSPVTNY